MNLIDKIEEAYCKKGLPEFRPGDTVCIFVKIREGEKERLQAYEGVVIRHRGAGSRSTITVRKVSYGVGVERIFPLYSPMIDSIEILKKSSVRRAKLYFIREKAVKEVAKRLKSIVVGKVKPEDIEPDLEENESVEAEETTESTEEVSEK